MKTKELADLCRAGETIIVVIPRPKTRLIKDHIRLAGKGGPFGRVLNVKDSAKNKTLVEVCAVFKSAQVLQWLKSIGELEE